MMEEFELILQRPDGSRVPVSICVDDDGEESEPYSIRFGHSEFGHESFGGQDYFDCLKQLRLRFEPIGIKVLCNGARINAVCSGMSSSMGGCQSIYLVELGRPGRNLVSIFEEAPANAIATVAEQEVFRQRWFDSLR
jgi:hypothetical protein